MANATIPMLPQATGITGDEQMEGVQAGQSVRFTTAMIAALATGLASGPTGPAGVTGPTGPTGPALAGATIVASLGTPTLGLRFMVTDATATTFASIVTGGGSNIVPVYADGTNWNVG